jgi:hypothetical protein
MFRSDCPCAASPACGHTGTLPGPQGQALALPVSSYPVPSKLPSGSTSQVCKPEKSGFKLVPTAQEARRDPLPPQPPAGQCVRAALSRLSWCLKNGDFQLGGSIPKQHCPQGWGLGELHAFWGGVKRASTQGPPPFTLGTFLSRVHDLPCHNRERH